jgi:hypothetical protein
MAEERDYVALKACGCLSLWCSGALPPKEFAKDIAAALRRGCQVVRMATDDVRKLEFRCPHEPAKKPRRKKAAP